MLWNASLEGTTVLVVDDEVDSRELTALVLSMAGAQVCAVASATEALRVLQHGDNYDVVITDIGMPVATYAPRFWVECARSAVIRPARSIASSPSSR